MTDTEPTFAAVQAKALALVSEHPIPIERSPKGRTRFRVYLVTSVMDADRSQLLPLSFMDLEGHAEGETGPGAAGEREAG